MSSMLSPYGYSFVQHKHTVLKAGEMGKCFENLDTQFIALSSNFCFQFTQYPVKTMSNFLGKGIHKRQEEMNKENQPC